MIQTEAIVLHGFDYRETSRIVRLATRDVGVVSAIARGARRPRSRFGHALDLFTSGVAHLTLHTDRDLHTLGAFDATRTRTGLAGSLRRFGAATALGELCLRFAPDDQQGATHDALARGLDALGAAPDVEVASHALAAGWRLVVALGFAPALRQCALCDQPLAPDAAVRFGHQAGGALCRLCATTTPGARALPPEARAAIVEWLDGEHGGLLDASHARAHQRLLREFLEQHLVDGRPLRAWASWESLGW